MKENGRRRGISRKVRACVRLRPSPKTDRYTGCCAAPTNYIVKEEPAGKKNRDGLGQGGEREYDDITRPPHYVRLSLRHHTRLGKRRGREASPDSWGPYGNG